MTDLILAKMLSNIKIINKFIYINLTFTLMIETIKDFLIIIKNKFYVMASLLGFRYKFSNSHSFS